MTILASKEALRPAETGLKSWLTQKALASRAQSLRDPALRKTDS